jgi:hypothetical protein
MASAIISKLLMVTSPLAKKAIDHVFKRDVNLLTVQSYFSVYGKISVAFGIAVAASNFIHGVWTIATVEDKTLDESEVRIMAYNKDDPYPEQNIPFEVTMGPVLIFSIAKGLLVDAFWPCMLLKLIAGTDHISRSLTLGFSLRS